MKHALAAQIITVQTGMIDGQFQNGNEKLLSVNIADGWDAKTVHRRSGFSNQPFIAKDPHSLMQIYA
jgi:hypothetical protein